MERQIQHIKGFYKFSPKGRKEYDKLEYAYKLQMSIYAMSGCLLGYTLNRTLLSPMLQKLSFKSTTQRQMKTIQLIMTLGLVSIYGHKTENRKFEEAQRALIEDSSNLIDDY